MDEWRNELLTELEAHIRVRPETVHDGRTITIAYEVRDLVGYRVEDNDKETPLYPTIGATSSDDQTTDIDKAERLIHGFIKWDGCSHNYFSTYQHECDRKGLVRLGGIFARLFDLAIELMPHAREYLD